MSFRKEYPAVYAGNVHRDLSASHLSHIFAPLGSFQLLTHDNGRSKGWGFLCFANDRDAGRAYTYLLKARLMIRGLTLEIGHNVRTWGTTDANLARRIDSMLANAYPPTAPAEIKARIAKLSHSVFVGNLPEAVSKKDLHDLFADCGEIASAFVALNRNRECLGYGFIDFNDKDSAETAVERLHGIEWRGKIIRVDIGEDVNRNVEWPFSAPAAPKTTIAAAPATSAVTNPAPWSAVIAQRAPAAPTTAAAASTATARPPPPTAIVPAIPVAPRVAIAAASAAKSSQEALNDTIRLIAPNLLQIALAVNEVDGLGVGVGVEEAKNRLLQSDLLRKAVKDMVGKVKQKE
ncbi:uncharacterized protein AB675_4213 [Cyphellophora attinorum]|jgi:RNA recognition motif. (a.k.a. RRM, RBD, or RNP domain)|uniref:RRM domain-containing protein n=1 Tax=Cyphellophora attinorum TaxID=1664694 RepID=A0A0N1P022_9EURO|nr:uncharacterized protein AB675_4213 [Phialophora attinorum]KPI38502.1 hypothetical protein AB675_4213 [Phialophora attinorum]